MGTNGTLGEFLDEPYAAMAEELQGRLDADAWLCVWDTDDIQVDGNLTTKQIVLLADLMLRMRLRELTQEMRAVASRTGPMHSFWDVIADVECFIDGKPTLLKKTGLEWLAECEHAVRPNGPHDGPERR